MHHFREAAVLRKQSRIVLGHHLVMHGYGHWLPNDPRGSGSVELRQSKLSELGPIHTGRKRVQPSRAELKQFHRQAQPKLEFPALWFDNAKRQAIAEAFARVVNGKRYTAWECAVLSNHAHLCVGKHRHLAETIWQAFAEASRDVPAHIR